MSALPEFSYYAIVRPRWSKQDKITLVVSHRVYDGRIANLDSFRNYLGGVPEHFSPQLAGESFSRIFNRPGLQQDFKIREDATVLPAPLFKGNYRVPRYRGGPTDEVSIPSTLKLILNPSRFLRHQDPNRYFPPRRTAHFATPTLFGERHPDAGGEFALDNSDNWIPATIAFAFANQGELWRSNLRAYIGGVLQEIDNDTERAAEIGDVNWRPSGTPNPFSLRHVETYFEFRSPHPIRAVADLCPLLHSYNELNSSVAAYPVRCVERREKNALVFSKRIGAGVTLTVYAKTNRRLRVEVMHDLTESGLRISTTDSGRSRVRHTCANIGGVYKLLESVRFDAAEIVNDVLKHLRSRARIPATSKTSIDLLFDIAKVVGESKNAKTLIYGLCSKGSVSSLPALQLDLLKLRRAGILETQQRNQRQEYIVTAEYQHSLQMLQAYGTFRHLMARRRTPPPAA